ncbi:PREDICTED: chymotrypsin-2-like [Ceratosolen solmsi marchali]|uniref:Chymotrypsin-2-like n=1 Tax=Ceratosolen solmsi marchali TaxID=326594 RepID=A0AAJ6VLW9_9HYME|nr:PREDICTED: chymotrypsin-2-like [Ceratosolen solmsi marchali]
MNILFTIVLWLQLEIAVFGKSTRIIGGEPVDINKHAYMAALRNVMPDYHFCGATIISNKHMLTAGHCLYNKLENLNRIRVYTGSNSPSSYSGKAHKILQVHVHPAYNETKSTNHDLAILTLKDPLIFGPTHKSVALPIENIREGSFAVALGWGLSQYPSTTCSNVLRKTRLKIWNVSKCKEFFGSLQKQQFCAFDKAGVGICHGDSGGPLIINGRVIGITSINFPCAKGYPDIFVNVFDYLGFIKHIIDK